jgi:hypothetical protein
MKTYEKLARFIEHNDDDPQSCLNTTFTQDHKRKILILSLRSLHTNNCKALVWLILFSAGYGNHVAEENTNSLGGYFSVIGLILRIF